MRPGSPKVHRAREWGRNDRGREQDGRSCLRSRKAPRGTARQTYEGQPGEARPQTDRLTGINGRAAISKENRILRRRDDPRNDAIVRAYVSEKDCEEVHKNTAPVCAERC